jgi:hypothetical protein
MDAIYTTIMKIIHDRYYHPQHSEVITNVPLAKFNDRLALSQRFRVFESGNGIVGSHSSHVPYARDLCKARIYAADTTSEEKQASINQQRIRIAIQ